METGNHGRRGCYHREKEVSIMRPTRTPKPKVSKAWKERIIAAIENEELITEILSFVPAKKWITYELAKRGIPFSKKSLKDGVIQITTDTTVCPFCGTDLHKG